MAAGAPRHVVRLPRRPQSWIRLHSRRPCPAPAPPLLAARRAVPLASVVPGGRGGGSAARARTKTPPLRPSAACALRGGRPGQPGRPHGVAPAPPARALQTRPAPRRTPAPRSAPAKPTRRSRQRGGPSRHRPNRGLGVLCRPRPSQRLCLCQACWQPRRPPRPRQRLCASSRVLPPAPAQRLAALAAAAAAAAAAPSANGICPFPLWTPTTAPALVAGRPWPGALPPVSASPRSLWAVLWRHRRTPPSRPRQRGRCCSFPAVWTTSNSYAAFPTWPTPHTRVLADFLVFFGAKVRFHAAFMSVAFVCVNRRPCGLAWTLWRPSDQPAW